MRTGPTTPPTLDTLHGTLLHNKSCASYASHTCCECVPRALRIVQQVADIVRVVERFF